MATALPIRVIQAESLHDRIESMQLFGGGDLKARVITITLRYSLRHAAGEIGGSAGVSWLVRLRTTSAMDSSAESNSWGDARARPGIP
jgi:hypothetical protein